PCLRDLHSVPTRRSSDLGNGHDGEVFQADASVDGVVQMHALGVAAREVEAVRELDVGVDAVTGENGDAGFGHLKNPAACARRRTDRKSTRLNSSHVKISY